MDRMSVTRMMIEAESVPSRVCVQELMGFNGTKVTLTYSAKLDTWTMVCNGIPAPLKINLEAAAILIAEVGNEA